MLRIKLSDVDLVPTIKHIGSGVIEVHMPSSSKLEEVLSLNAEQLHSAAISAFLDLFSDSHCPRRFDHVENDVVISSLCNECKVN